MQQLFLTRFIGREDELSEIQRLFTISRLVTITGAGGCGKTRLAVQVAGQIDDAFADGTYFIPLAAVDDPTLVIPTIAHAVGVGETPDDLLLTNLKAYLRRKQMLLLLDNFEQIIAAAPLLSELLLAGEQLKMLVTSREALRLRGEQEYPLQPMEVPQPNATTGQNLPKQLAQLASVRLFVDRARASAPDFALTAENGATIAAICARLDGLPLAIELAAGRSRLLPPKAMLTRLQESALGLLISGARDLPVRQQTLRATVQWSYDLLPPQEQLTLRCLTVFVGGCSLDAVASVLGNQSAASTADAVDSLISKSLVRRTDNSGEPRLSLLETVREFGLEQLAGRGELKAVQQAHAAYYLTLAKEAKQHLSGAAQKEWLARLEREQDNLRAALRWGFRSDIVGTSAGITFVLRMTASLSPFWYLRGHWSEGRRWLEEAVQHASGTTLAPALHAEVLLGAARLIHYQGDLAYARALCRKSMAIYQALDDQEGRLAAILQDCRTADYQGDYEPLPALIAEGLALAQSLPDSRVKAQAYAELPFPALAHGAATIDRTEHYLHESERIYRAFDNPAGRAHALFVLSALAEINGDSSRSRSMLEEAEHLASSVEDQHLKLGLLGRRTVINLRQKNYARARHAMEQVIAMPLGVAQKGSNLQTLAVILQRQGLTQWSAQVFGLADKLAAAGQSAFIGRKLFERERQRAAAVRAEVAAQLGEAAFADALAAGRRMTVEDVFMIPHPDSAGPAESPILEPLTPREAEVLHLLADALSNPQIAERLVISRRTVDAHLRSIYRKLGVATRESAVRLATEHNLLQK